MKFFISSFTLLALSAAAPVAFGGDPEVRPPLPSSGEVEDPLPSLRSGSKGGSGNEALELHDLSGAAISSTIDKDVGGTLFVSHDVSDGALDPPIGEDAGGSRFDGSNGAADPLGSGDGAHLDFGSKRRFLSFKKAPKFLKKHSKKAKKSKIVAPPMTPPSDRANIAGKYTYFPDCKNYINEVTIWCENDICTFFQEALERLECGEVVEDANRCQLVGQFSYQDKVQSTKLETIDLVSYGVCRFKDGDVVHGAPNAVRAEIDPNGTVNLFYSVDGGNSFFTDVRVAEPDDGLSDRRRLQSCGGQCGGKQSVTLCSGKKFCSIPSVNDLVRGYSLTGATNMRPAVFKKPDSYSFVKADSLYELTEYITSGTSAMESTGVSGEMTASYGPISSSASFDYFKGSSSSEKTFRYTIKIVRQAYNAKPIDTSQLKLSDEASIALADGGAEKLYENHGTHYVSDVVFGATLTIEFESSSSTSESKGDIAAGIQAGVKSGVFSAELTGKLNEKNTKIGEFLRIKVFADGIDFSTKPEHTEPMELEYVIKCQKAFMAESNEKFAQMHEYVKDNPTVDGTTDSNIPLKIIGFIASPIREAATLDANSIAPKVASNMAKVGEILATASYNIARLKIIKKDLDDEKVNDANLRQIMNSWDDEYKRLMPLLEATLQACYDYKQQTVTSIMNGDAKIPEEISLDAIQQEITGLTGDGFISAPATVGTEVFPDMLYQGFVIKGKAWYKGTLKCVNGVDYSKTSAILELEKTSRGSCLDVTELARVEMDGTAEASSVGRPLRLPDGALDNYQFTFAETIRSRNPWWHLKLDDIYKVTKIEIIHAPPKDGNNMAIVSKSNGVAKYGAGSYTVPTIPLNGQIFEDGEQFIASFTEEDLSALDTVTDYCIDNGYKVDKDTETQMDCSIVHYRDKRDGEKWYNRLRCRDPTSRSYSWLPTNSPSWFGFNIAGAAMYDDRTGSTRVPGKSLNEHRACTFYKTTPGGEASASNYDSQREDLLGFEVLLVKGGLEKLNDKLVPKEGATVTWKSGRQTKPPIPDISSFYPAGNEGNHVVVRIRGTKTIRLAGIRVWVKFADLPDNSFWR